MSSPSRAPLPPPPPAKPSIPWDVVRHGELMSPPHKVWTHDLFPSHTHENFHSFFLATT